jgi:hypothetical protein
MCQGRSHPSLPTTGRGQVSISVPPATRSSHAAFLRQVLGCPPHLTPPGAHEGTDAPPGRTQAPLPTPRGEEAIPLKSQAATNTLFHLGREDERPPRPASPQPSHLHPGRSPGSPDARAPCEQPAASASASSMARARFSAPSWRRTPQAPPPASPGSTASGRFRLVS